MNKQFPPKNLPGTFTSGREYNDNSMADKAKIYEDVSKIKSNAQGGKNWGKAISGLDAKLDAIGEEYMQKNPDAPPEDVAKFKIKFVEYDVDQSGDINVEELGLMMEKLGKPKNQLELKKMIAQVDKSGTGAITYYDFLEMMLGKGGNSILKKILLFESFISKDDEKPQGPPPKKTLKDLI